MLSKIKTALLILIILIAAFSPMPQRCPELVEGAQPVVMKRESRITPISLDEALDISLAYGYRSVKWAAVGMEG